MSTAAKEFTKEQEAKETTKKVSGAEALLMALVEEGVDTMFGYPGGAIMPVYDKLYHYDDKLKHILVRHEQGATHAAQGYARVNHRVGVCLATSGPGATNLITGLADAMIDSTPMVAITGQVASHLLGTDAFQETDVVGISTPVTKWNYQVTKASEIPEAIAKAFYIAKSGRPGPVLIDITKDAQFEEFDFSYKPCTKIRSYKPVTIAEESALDAAAELINAAKKPYILVGHGVMISKAEKELLAFAEKAGIPMASTLLGLSSVPVDHPLYVGYLGMHGNYGANIKTNECDLLIAIGMRFDDRVTGDLSRYATQAKVIHVEIDPSEIDKNVKADVPIIADAKEALGRLIPKVKDAKHDDWLAEFHACDEIEKKEVLEYTLGDSTEKVKMSEVIKMLSDKTKGEAIIVTDVGQHQMEACRYYDFKITDSIVSSGGLGTMGFALPAAMGAAVGAPDRLVVSISGDGGYQMTVQELGTIFQYKIPVKILVLNNSFLGMVRQWQELFFDRRYSFTEMVNPDFVKMAESYYIKADKSESREDLSAKMDQWLSTEGPCFLEVVVEKESNVFPMIPTGESVSNVRLK
ncbi:biosynthetic-type acetolactate synthase large subunit [Flammeovirga pacifica]|uniref:Acetolactate synthase n=1 Tax=Flammeovirga pacifica TaxID=915059 RepID=A0A1S1Z4G2_FLAPC|nr:biosynthetic-type acetolactate synthase large subunit [Flammeovirga pacifica]OHX68117.1 acetolactate synthase, large subunit, biosynthetic type [Flammeovirga pacifica]